jgi:DNA-binding MarR family transcriptional regulator
MLEDKVYEQPGHLIRRAHQIAWAMFREETSEFDMTPVQYSLMIAIHDFPAIDATRLSALICIDRATIGNIVARLEARGYLVRKDDPDDKRAKKIFVTQSGQAVIQSINKVRGRIGQRVLEPLDGVERKMLIRLLCKLVNINDVKRIARELWQEAEEAPQTNRRRTKRRASEPGARSLKRAAI